MTDNQAAILKEIKLYNERLGRWPTVSALQYIMGLKSNGSMSTTIKRMVDNGYLEYVGEWKNGQPRPVKPC